MVLGAESVRERLLRLEEAISQLEQLRARRSGSEDYRDRWAIERGLQLGAEILLDIGNHLLSAHFGVSARDYEDILTQLVAQQVLSPTLHARLKGMGGGSERARPRLHAPRPGDRQRAARASTDGLLRLQPGGAGLARKDGDAMSLSGGCHCGRVRFRIDASLDGVTECNCSICTRKAFCTCGQRASSSSVCTACPIRPRSSQSTLSAVPVPWRSGYVAASRHTHSPAGTRWSAIVRSGLMN